MEFCMVAVVSQPVMVIKVLPGSKVGKRYVLKPGRYGVKPSDDPIDKDSPQWLILLGNPHVGAVATWWEGHPEIQLIE
jgi:hypothetical protein